MDRSCDVQSHCFAAAAREGFPQAGRQQGQGGGGRLQYCHWAAKCVVLPKSNLHPGAWLVAKARRRFSTKLPHR